MQSTLFRDDQVNVLIRRYQEKYDRLFATKTYEAGRELLLSWLRSYYGREMTPDIEYHAICCFEDLWRNEYYPDKTTMLERKIKRENRPSEIKAREEAHEWIIQHDKKWVLERIEHWLKNMQRWKEEGHLKESLENERYHDEDFQNSINTIVEYHGHDVAAKYIQQHEEIIEDLCYKSEERYKKTPEETRISIFYDFLLSEEDELNMAQHMLDDIILYNSEEDAVKCREAYNERRNK